MNISAIQNQSYLGTYPQISVTNNKTTKTNSNEKNLKDVSSSKSKGFSWTELWDIIADISSIIAGRKTLKGTIAAIKSAYEKIKNWF